MSEKLSAENMEFLDMRMRELGEALRCGLEEKLRAKLADLEGSVLDRLDALESALAATAARGGSSQKTMPPAAGMGFPPGIFGGGDDPADSALNMCRSQGARLAMLEESFARICNLVGRMDQELEMLREEVRAGKG